MPWEAGSGWMAHPGFGCTPSGCAIFGPSPFPCGVPPSTTWSCLVDLGRCLWAKITHVVNNYSVFVVFDPHSRLSAVVFDIRGLVRCARIPIRVRCRVSTSPHSVGARSLDDFIRWFLCGPGFRCSSACLPLVGASSVFLVGRLHWTLISVGVGRFRLLVPQDSISRVSWSILLSLAYHLLILLTLVHRFVSGLEARSHWLGCVNDSLVLVV